MSEKPAWKKWLWVGKLLFTAGMVWWLSRMVQWGQIYETVSHTSLEWVALAVALNGLMAVFQSLRWKYALEINREFSVPFRHYFYYTYLGYVYNLILPSSTGGDAVKSVAMGRKINGTADSVHSVLLTRMAGLYALVFIYGVNWFLGGSIWKQPYDKAVILLIVMLMILLGCILAAGRSRKLMNRLEGLHPWVKPLYHYLNYPKGLLICFGFSILVQFLIVYIHYVIFLSLGGGVPFQAAFTFMPLIILFLSIPISIFGLGLRELATIQLFTLIPGVTKEFCVASNVIAYGLAFLQAFIGLAYYAWRNLIQKNQTE